MSSEMILPMVQLDSLLNKTNIAEFAHWVLDVQGAELKVLIGAGSLLNSCNSIKVEISTRQVYKGGTKYTLLKQFLAKNSFFPLWEPESRSHEDIIFSECECRISPSDKSHIRANISYDRGYFHDIDSFFKTSIIRTNSCNMREKRKNRNVF